MRLRSKGGGDRGGRTELVVRMLFALAESRDRAAREIGAVEGLPETLGSLAHFLTMKGETP